MLFVSFIQSAEYGIANLFIPARLRALTENSRLRANEVVLIPLSGEVGADSQNVGFYVLLAPVLLI